MKSESCNKSKQIKGLADVIIKALVKELMTEVNSQNKHEKFDTAGKGKKR